MASALFLSTNSANDIMNGQVNLLPVFYKHSKPRHSISDNYCRLAAFVLSQPAPAGTAPVKVLKAEYSYVPKRNAILVFQMLQRAMHGDAYLGLALFALAGYGGYIDKLFAEDAQFIGTLL